MSEPTTIHDTFTLERTYVASAAKVFALLADPAKKRRWFAEGAVAFEMDFREGGAERSASKMGAETPFPGVELANQGVFQDIQTNRRVVIAGSMTLGGRRISSSLVTFELIDAPGGGVTLVLTHQAVFYEGSDGPERRRGGWEALLDRFGQALMTEPA